MSSYLGNKSSYLSFLRTDVVWVAAGQFCAATTGLISLKILTNLFNAEQYAYIALMMALASWIWMGIYQPLNQTLFRYYSIATKDDWLPQFCRQIIQYEKKIALSIVTCMALFLLAGYYKDYEYGFILLVLISGAFGIIYGCVHGLLYCFLAQRKRRPVTFIQATEGAVRLACGLLAFYLFSKDQYTIIVGFLCGGGIVLISILALFKDDIGFSTLNGIQLPLYDQRVAISKYFRQTLLLTALNASVIYLDKWFLFYLIGDESLGKYAVIFTLAFTVTSMLYAFFEMVGFPIIFKEQSVIIRKKLIKILLFAYFLANALLAVVVFLFGETILLFLSSQYVAMEHSFFWVLIVACGLLHFGRILMIEGQISVEPGKYWPAYLNLLVVFVGWCLLFVESGSGKDVANGFLFASIIFVLHITYLNGNRCWPFVFIRKCNPVSR